ncbi:MAG: PKD domain-containing protein [Promethearchaeota archaeon]
MKVIPRLTYQWDFGDGSSNSTEVNPDHQFTAAGTYTITLTITDVDGDANTCTITDFIVVKGEETTKGTQEGGKILDFIDFFILG